MIYLFYASSNHLSNNYTHLSTLERTCTDNRSTPPAGSKPHARTRGAGRATSADTSVQLAVEFHRIFRKNHRNTRTCNRSHRPHRWPRSGTCDSHNRLCLSCNFHPWSQVNIRKCSRCRGPRISRRFCRGCTGPCRMGFSFRSIVLEEKESIKNILFMIKISHFVNIEKKAVSEIITYFLDEEDISKIKNKQQKQTYPCNHRGICIGTLEWDPRK